MKKTLIGIGWILFAAYLIFKDSLKLPSLDLPIWTLVAVIAFGIGAFQNLFRRDYMSSYACAALAFIFLENHYNWLAVGTGTLIVAAIVAGIGLSMIIKPKLISVKYYKGKDKRVVDWSDDPEMKEKSDTTFSNKTRYINGDFTDVAGDVVFSSASIYFDNADIDGDKATYSGDAVFSSVKLYIPENWRVEMAGDRVFSGINLQPSGHPSEKTLVVTGDFVFSSLTVIYI